MTLKKSKTHGKAPKPEVEIVTTPPPMPPPIPKGTPGGKKPLPPLTMTIAIDRDNGLLSISDSVMQETAFEDLTALSDALNFLGGKIRENLIAVAKEAGKKEAQDEKVSKLEAAKQARNERRRKATQAKKEAVSAPAGMGA